MLCMSALFAATLSTSPANRRFGYTDRRAGADQNHLPSSIRAIRTTSHAAGASSATCTSPSQERQLTCSCVAAGISTLRAGVPRLRGSRDRQRSDASPKAANGDKDAPSAQSGTVIGPGQMRVEVRKQGALPHPAERTSEVRPARRGREFWPFVKVVMAGSPPAGSEIPVRYTKRRRVS